MKIFVSNIDWDYPGKRNGTECPFPTKITIEVEPSSPLLEDINGEAENLVEYLTDEYGCCICGFVPEVEGVEGNG